MASGFRRTVLKCSSIGALVFSICGGVDGQSSPANHGADRAELLQQRRKQQPDLMTLMDRAQAAPPEFLADVLLRVVESGRISDPVWKEEILDQAFQTALLAPESVRRSAEEGATDLISLDLSAHTRAQMLTLGFDQRLDRLTLQSRAVKEMMKLDRPKGLEMFQSIIFPALDPRSCRDALIDDVSEYYETLTLVVNSAFSPADRRSGSHLKLLSSAIAGMTSPVQVGPLAKALYSVSLDDGEIGFLAASFAGALERLPSDDRSLSATLSSTATEVGELIQRLKAGAAMPNTVSSAYRQWLVRGYKGKRCSDNLGEHDPLNPSIETFNKVLASDADPNLAPIRTAEMERGPLGDPADTGPFFEDSEFVRAFQQFTELLVGPGNGLLHERLSDSEKDSIPWRVQFDDFLRRVDESTPAAGEPEDLYFYRTAALLTALAGSAPPGADWEKAIRHLVQFLDTSNMRQESILGWYAQLQRTATAVRELRSVEQYGTFLGLLELSGDPVLDVFALRSKLLAVR
jgi:hypothetical protein